MAKTSSLSAALASVQDAIRDALTAPDAAPKPASTPVKLADGTSIRATGIPTSATLHGLADAVQFAENGDIKGIKIGDDTTAFQGQTGRRKVNGGHMSTIGKALHALADLTAPAPSKARVPVIDTRVNGEIPASK